MHPCSDGIDNDGDGCIDYPRDAGCGSPPTTRRPKPAAPSARTASMTMGTVVRTSRWIPAAAAWTTIRRATPLASRAAAARGGGSPRSDWAIPAWPGARPAGLQSKSRRGRSARGVHAAGAGAGVDRGLRRPRATDRGAEGGRGSASARIECANRAGSPARRGDLHHPTHARRPASHDARHRRAGDFRVPRRPDSLSGSGAPSRPHPRGTTARRASRRAAGRRARPAGAPSPRARRARRAGAGSVAVPTCTAAAPTAMNSSASRPLTIPPEPITGMRTAPAARGSARARAA